ncbi:MAG: hypothetical protein L6282_05930 [Candidatus Methanoperedenaceae archaeon]|nr:hypothetical protein [Candidatus Methanoperedenaceae archaeon]
MKQRPPVVRVLDASVYTKIAGELRKSLPGKVVIDIDRAVDARWKEDRFTEVKTTGDSQDGNCGCSWRGTCTT